MAQRRQAPRAERQRIAALGTDAINEHAEKQQADGVGALERRVDATELLVGPAELGIENRLEQREDLAIEIVDRRREEQQAADQPTIATDALGALLHGPATS
jgi:hypothetical protein